MLKAKPWKGQQLAYAHNKLDGIMLQVYKNEHGGVSMTTRKPTDITDALKNCGWMYSIYSRLPCDTYVWGELWVPGEKASQVKSAVAHDVSRLKFSGFAIMRHDIGPGAELVEVNDTLTKWGINCIDYQLHCSLHQGTYGGYAMFDDPLDLLENMADDLEGFVLKEANLLEWYKLKPVKTIDLIVTGYKPGKFGKYYKQVGALLVSTIEGEELARVSGMDDETRLEITNNQNAYLGRVVEVRYQYIGDKGRLRHPAFVRWRDDKPASECTLSQDSDLEDYYEKDNN